MEKAEFLKELDRRKTVSFAPDSGLDI